MNRRKAGSWFHATRRGGREQGEIKLVSLCHLNELRDFSPTADNLAQEEHLLMGLAIPALAA